MGKFKDLVETQVRLVSLNKIELLKYFNKIYRREYDKYLEIYNKASRSGYSINGVSEITVMLSDADRKRTDSDFIISIGNSIRFRKIINGNTVEHRIDGPAIINSGGAFMSWRVMGKRHRTDGPAFISKNLEPEYDIKGRKLSREEFLKHFDDTEEGYEKIFDQHGTMKI